MNWEMQSFRCYAKRDAEKRYKGCEMLSNGYCKFYSPSVGKQGERLGAIMHSDRVEEY